MHLAGQILASPLRSGPAPFKLNFAYTYHCNSRCVTCDIWKKKPAGELTPEEVARVARRTPSISWISLTGGEPFLRPDLVAMARAFAENLPHLALLNIPTNGSMPRRIERAGKELLGLKVPRLLLTVSLDGDEALHDETRGIPGGWQKALDSYARLKALQKDDDRLKVYFAYTVSPWNVGAFEKTFEAVREHFPALEARDFHINLYHQAPHYYANHQSGRTLEALARETQRELDLIGRMKAPSVLDPVNCIETTYLHLARRFAGSHRTPLPCKALISTAFLDSMGNVYPCTIWGKKLGNVRERDYDLMSVLRTGESARTRREIREGKCPQCWTPCESYPMLFGAPLKSLRALVEAAMRGRRPLPPEAPAAEDPSVAAAQAL